MDMPTFSTYVKVVCCRRLVVVLNAKNDNYLYLTKQPTKSKRMGFLGSSGDSPGTGKKHVLTKNLFIYLHIMTKADLI